MLRKKFECRCYLYRLQFIAQNLSFLGVIFFTTLLFSIISFEKHKCKEIAGCMKLVLAPHTNLWSETVLLRKHNMHVSI